MSPEALDLRVRELAQLYKLGVALRDAQLLGSVEELRVTAEGGAGARGQDSLLGRREWAGAALLRDGGDSGEKPGTRRALFILKAGEPIR